MNALRSAVLATVVSCCAICGAAEPNKDEPALEPWTHEYYWEEFTLSKEAPSSGDGRYRLKSVSKNGDVELFYSPTPEQKEVIVVKPMPKRFKKGDRLPTIVVKASNVSTQSAILRELRMK